MMAATFCSQSWRKPNELKAETLASAFLITRDNGYWDRLHPLPVKWNAHKGKINLVVR